MKVTVFRSWHGSRVPFIQPSRISSGRSAFATDTNAQKNVKATARETFWEHCQEIDGLLSGKDWMMGTQYTAVDPYALFFYNLGFGGSPSGDA